MVYEVQRLPLCQNQIFSAKKFPVPETLCPTLLTMQIISIKTLYLRP